jgi:16S rRNA (adenine1518-N6/adenine1519-N6)-dimethyltransferase
MPAEAERILRAAGVDPGARGESLTVADFARIAVQARGGDPPEPPDGRKAP